MKSSGRLILAAALCLPGLMSATIKTFAEAYDELEKGKYVDVLEYAIEQLRHDPDSFKDLFLFGAAVHRGEGNLPLAQRRLEAAERIAAKSPG